MLENPFSSLTAVNLPSISVATLTTMNAFTAILRTNHVPVEPNPPEPRSV